MTIYLDSWKHLISDESVTELWDFADTIGLKADWNHYTRGYPHFDLMKSKIKDAIIWGANEIEMRSPEHMEIRKNMKLNVFNQEWHDECAVWFPGVGKLGQNILRLDIMKTIEKEKSWLKLI